VQQRGAELVLAGVGVLLDEADVLQRAQQAVDRALRQPQLSGKVDDAQAARPARQQPQDRRGALDRLDRARGPRAARARPRATRGVV